MRNFYKFIYFSIRYNCYEFITTFVFSEDEKLFMNPLVAWLFSKLSLISNFALVISATKKGR